jgi:hypothetical protein
VYFQHMESMALIIELYCVVLHISITKCLIYARENVALIFSWP